MSPNHPIAPIQIALDHPLPPHYMPCGIGSHLRRTAQCPYPGSLAESGSVIFSQLDTKWSLVNAPNHRVQQIGMIETLFEMVDNGQADTIAFPFAVTPARLERFKFSNPLPYLATNDLYALDVEQHRSAPLEATLNFLSVFDSYTFIGIVACFVMLWAYGMLAKKYRLPAARLFSPKISASWVALFVSILLALYRSSLLSKLLLPTHTFRFDDQAGLAALVKSGQLTLLTRNNSAAWHALEKTRFLGPLILRYPPKNVDTIGGYLKVGDYVKTTESHVFVHHAALVKYLTSSECNLRSVRLTENTGAKRLGFVFARNQSQSIIDRFNQAIDDSAPMIQSVQQRYETYLYGGKTKICDDSNDFFNGGKKRLQIAHVLGAFLVLIVGLGVGVLLGTVEKVVVNVKGRWYKL